MFRIYLHRKLLVRFKLAHIPVVPAIFRWYGFLICVLCKFSFTKHFAECTPQFPSNNGWCSCTVSGFAVKYTPFYAVLAVPRCLFGCTFRWIINIGLLNWNKWEIKVWNGIPFIVLSISTCTSTFFTLYSNHHVCHSFPCCWHLYWNRIPFAFLC